MSLRLLMFAEAPGDFRAAAILVDRVLAEDTRTSWTVDLLAPGELAASEALRESRHGLRRWVNEHGQDGEEGKETFLDVHHLDRVTKEIRREHQGFRLQRGHFDGQPGEACAKLGRKALEIAGVLHRKNALQAVFLIHDMDEEPTRHRGLAQARDEARTDFVVVLGCPSESMEAWKLAAFVAQDQDEQGRIARARAEHQLDFDPCEQAHRLSHKEQAPRSAKRVLALLSDESPERQEKGLRTAPLAVLRQRGKDSEQPGGDSGLEAFLREIERRVVPLLLSP